MYNFLVNLEFQKGAFPLHMVAHQFIIVTRDIKRAPKRDVLRLFFAYINLIKKGRF